MSSPNWKGLHLALARCDSRIDHGADLGFPAPRCQGLGMVAPRWEPPRCLIQGFALCLDLATHHLPALVQLSAAAASGQGADRDVSVSMGRVPRTDVLLLLTRRMSPVLCMPAQWGAERALL